jgi:hypothetical protein
VSIHKKTKRDFTLSIYQDLLDALMEARYATRSFCEVVQNPKESPGRWVILRHDVDRLPWNAVATAREEARRGMVASYYFRVVPGAWDERAIREVADLGHECGYHYEDMDLAKGNTTEAFDSYCKNLEKLRKICPVQTICMHGSPLSRWDNRALWKQFEYKQNGIVGEPYFDLNFNEVFYITDTGRCWNASEVSVRDKVKTCFDVSVTSTPELIGLIRGQKSPPKMMINTHPQRWTDKVLPWVEELMMQNLKNLAKRWIVARGKGGGEVDPAKEGVTAQVG